MDIPVWHPANVGIAGATSTDPNSKEPRTEFLVMPGSGIDPDVGGEDLIDELQGSSVPGFADPRGLYDTSDRLYMKEQTYALKLKEEAQRKEDEKALSAFYSAAATARLQQQQVLPPQTPRLTGSSEESNREKPLVAVKVKKDVIKETAVVVKKKKEKKKKGGGEKNSAKVSALASSLVSYSDAEHSHEEGETAPS